MKTNLISLPVMIWELAGGSKEKDWYSPLLREPQDTLVKRETYKSILL